MAGYLRQILQTFQKFGLLYITAWPLNAVGLKCQKIRFDCYYCCFLVRRICTEYKVKRGTYVAWRAWYDVAVQG